ncbi:lead, cadmium, zinc and mercury transporting ATPase [Cutibacterium acnes JCM 18918]|nr:lead, cadmium, zinc and mercury transporting ATPase [Cutibacterium acnes JCM 18918]
MSTPTHPDAQSELKDATEPTSINLDITGMSCASCAARIAKKLNKVDGAQATVNYATSKAHVLTTKPIGVDDLIGVVEAAGYGASVPTPAAPPEDHAAKIRARLIVAIILAVPVMLLSMIPALQFDGWQWLALALSSRSSFGAGRVSIAPPGRTCGMAQPQWTLSLASALWSRWGGLSGR